MPDHPSGEVVELRGRSGYRPDLAGLAREQLRQAREARDLDRQEFADLMSPMLGWNVSAELVESWETASVPPGDALVAAGLIAHAAGRSSYEGRDTDPIGQLFIERFADITEVYPTRAEFSSGIPPRELFGGAHDVRAAGLSLNLLCQQYGDRALRELVDAGAQVRCLFLEPGGTAIRTREREEGFPAGHLSALTELNIQGLIRRVRDKLRDDTRSRLEIGTYNETIRFNITVVDNELCVAQPYLPQARGVDSPTLVIRRRSTTSGLYPMFDQIFTSMWEGRHPYD
jgi:hypothetical protein